MTAPPREPGVRWDERLRPPVWSWPVAVVVLALFLGWGVALSDGTAALVPVLVVGGLVGVLVLVALARRSRGRVLVADGVLHVPGARVPLDVVGAVRPLDAEQTRRLRGPMADVRAYVAVPSWLRCAVQVRLDDPEDDTPYWLVGTRRPQDLAAAVEAARRDTSGGVSLGDDQPG